MAKIWTTARFLRASIAKIPSVPRTIPSRGFYLCRGAIRVVSVVEPYRAPMRTVRSVTRYDFGSSGASRRKAALFSGSVVLMNMPEPISNPATRVTRGMTLTYQ